MQTWTITSRYVTVEIQSLGAMVGPAVFYLPDREVQPLAIAPWAEEAKAALQPAILQRLRGEWPCVPFGIPSDRALPADWPKTGAEPDPAPHGQSSNSHWSLVHAGADRVRLELSYPAEHPIDRLRRTIIALSKRPALEFELEIVARHDCRLPIGIHPTFALPGPVGAVELSVSGDEQCWTYPVPAEPGISVLLPDQRNFSLREMPMTDGSLDLSRLPLSFATEELVLVPEAGGGARLAFPDAGYAVDLSWDKAVFASCMLWFSNRGRTAYPWAGRHLALGIEPVTSAFDLGTSISANADNPLARTGVRTARQFSAGETLTTTYAIEVQALSALHAINPAAEARA